VQAPAIVQPQFASPDVYTPQHLAAKILTSPGRYREMGMGAWLEKAEAVRVTVG
jgi:hypothetical protein